MDVVDDLVEQLRLAPPGTASDDLAAEHAKPNLDLVEPGGLGRCEMQAQPPLPGNPLFDRRMFVSAEVLADHMQIFVGVLEQAQEILMLMAGAASARYLSLMHGQPSRQPPGSWPTPLNCLTPEPRHSSLPAFRSQIDLPPPLRFSRRNWACTPAEC